MKLNLYARTCVALVSIITYQTDAHRVVTFMYIITKNIIRATVTVTKSISDPYILSVTLEVKGDGCKCVLITECPMLNAVVNKNIKSQEDISLLQKYYCGHQGTIPKVNMYIYKHYTK